MNFVLSLPMKIETSLLVLLSISGILSLQNGEPVQRGRFCYVVSLWVYELFTFEYRCSGIIISQSHILTAGHCVHDIIAHNIIVTTTETFEGITFQNPFMFVDAITFHPDFERKFHLDKPMTEYWIHDIAILKLICDLKLSPTLSATAWDRRHHYENNGEDCFIAGWAPMVINTTLHLVLSRTKAMVLGKGISQWNSFLLPHEIYAFLTQSQALIDDMDSGNALMCGGRAVGIIVGGRDRTRSVVSVLTIAPYKKFIDATMSVDLENRIL